MTLNLVLPKPKPVSKIHLADVSKDIWPSYAVTSTGQYLEKCFKKLSTFLL